MTSAENLGRIKTTEGIGQDDGIDGTWYWKRFSRLAVVPD